MKSSELIFRFREGHIDLISLSLGYKEINIRNTFNLEIENSSYNQQDLFMKDEYVVNTKKFIKENMIKSKKAKVILNLDGIITRLVECPKMSKKDIDKFIKNNIHEYFTVNMEDYFYDYKIVDIEMGKTQKMSIFLVVFPKLKLMDIIKYIKACDLEVDRFFIYPDCISNVFHHVKAESTAIFEVGRDRNNITILDKGKVFLYSAGANVIDDDEDFDEIIENMGYFLNFYASRHFGTNVTSIHLIGELGENDNLFNAIKEQFQIKVYRTLAQEGIKLSCKEGGSNADLYYDILGAFRDKKSIYNKKLDFSDALEDKKRSSENKWIFKISGFLILMSIISNISMKVYIDLIENKYNADIYEEQLSNLLSVEEAYKEAADYNNGINNKINFANNIEKNKLNYIGYLEALKKSLPNNITINSVTIERDTINLEVNIYNSTLDKVKLVIAINNTNIFEKIDLESIKLDDTETEFNVQLKIKTPM